MSSDALPAVSLSLCAGSTRVHFERVCDRLVGPPGVALRCYAAVGHGSRFVFVTPPVRSPLPPPDLIAVEVRGECVPGRVEVNLVLNLVRSDLAIATRAGSVAT